MASTNPALSRERPSPGPMTTASDWSTSERRSSLGVPSKGWARSWRSGSAPVSAAVDPAGATP